jgi:ubiquitin
MNAIVKMIDDYSKNLKEIGKSNCEDTVKIEQGIALSKKTLNQMRLIVRGNRFNSNKAEIKFFKHHKPFIYARLIYFIHRSKFYADRPSSNIKEQRKYINRLLKKLERKKSKHTEFYRYYKNNDSSLDSAYFLRGNEQLEIVFNGEYIDTDPEFSTSHDQLAAEVLAYGFLTNYYTKELEKLKIKESQQIGTEVKPDILNHISWTASKTDLVELLYALIASGAIKNGNVEIKNVVKACQLIFNIDLGNIYKTYTEIKARDKDQTKFLDKLKTNLIQKIDLEYAKN